jgi:endonuclease/exonuclease/phosphatase family metal-dependent hydrolase
MKIISWNINALSKKKSKVPFILRQKADVICLQEVTDALLAELRKSDYHIYLSSEVKGRKDAYSIIMSKKEARHHRIIDYRHMHKSFWRFFLKILGGIESFESVGHMADIGKYRVINLHLPSFASPYVRQEELEAALALKKENTIICGDLNTYGIWYINWFLAFILNIRIKDLFKNEIKEFGKIFRVHRLKNIFKGEKTSTFVNITKHHSDYILVSHDQKERYHKVFRYRHGSDHHMIMAVLKD